MDYSGNMLFYPFHVAVNIMTLKNQHFRVRFGEGVIKKSTICTLS